MHKFTVIWGNIGDDSGKRLDHVTVTERTHKAVMDAAFDCFMTDLTESGVDLTDADRAEYRDNTAYDGYAILDGHISDSPDVYFG